MKEVYVRGTGWKRTSSIAEERESRRPEKKQAEEETRPTAGPKAETYNRVLVTSGYL